MAARDGLAAVLAARVGVRSGHACLGDAVVASAHPVDVFDELFLGDFAYAQRRVCYGESLPKVQPAHAVKCRSQQRGHGDSARLGGLLVRDGVTEIGFARPDSRAGRYGKVDRVQEPMGDRESLQDGCGGPTEAPGRVELVQRSKNVERPLGGGESVEPVLLSCVQPRKGRDERPRAYAPIERPAEVLVGRGQTDSAKLRVVEQLAYGFVDACVHRPSNQVVRALCHGCRWRRLGGA